MQAYPMPGAILLFQNTRSEMLWCPGASSPLFLTHVQCWQLETGHHRSTHSAETGKCHKAGLLSTERAVNLHQHTLETPPALPQPPVGCTPTPHCSPVPACPPPGTRLLHSSPAAPPPAAFPPSAGGPLPTPWPQSDAVPTPQHPILFSSSL